MKSKASKFLNSCFSFLGAQVSRNSVQTDFKKCVSDYKWKHEFTIHGGRWACAAGSIGKGKGYQMGRAGHEKHGWGVPSLQSLLHRAVGMEGEGQGQGCYRISRKYVRR